MKNMPGHANEGVNGHDSSEFTGQLQLKPSVMDLLSNEASLQWWYLNAHLKEVDSEKEFSFFTSLFALQDNDEEIESNSFYYACTWALIDVAEKKYHPDSLLDRRTTKFVTKRIDDIVSKSDSKNPPEQLLRAMLLQDRLPLPDRPMEKATIISQDSLKINLNDECLFEAEGDDAERRYKVYHHNPRRNVTVELEFSPRTGPVLNGDNGFVNKMFYYYYPSMSVEGRITIGDTITHVKGDGWYDREYGVSKEKLTLDTIGGWNWFGLHLSNGYQLNMYEVFDGKTGQKTEEMAVLTSDGKRYTCHDLTIEVKEWWTSLVTFHDYPVAFHIEVPSLQLSFDLRASFNHQEFQTIVALFGFYEGRMTGEGSHEGTPVSILGFYERKNLVTRASTSNILKKLGNQVKDILSELYPLDASAEWIEKHVLGRYSNGKGIPPRHLCDALFRPVRFLIDRGGKYWRSLFFIACCGALSADYVDATRFISISELGHVGSLIIDDIEDESTLRRGGKTVHMEFGTATAINAGTACFFMGISFADVKSLPAEKANRLYELYFEMMKAGHAGQGLDIRGLGHLMPEVVRTGQTEALEDAIKAIHRCKTGCICGALCTFSCIVADASEEVISAMEQFGIAIGLSYQIIDDALSVKGFKGELKEAGEDIRAGKITYPVAKAMGKLELSQRERLWSILQECTSDGEKIEEALNLLNSVNVVEECVEEAQKFVEEKWKIVDSLIPDSIPKIMLQLVCVFITMRSF